MDVLFEQESNMSTIAALSTIAIMKTDTNHTAINRHVQTDIVKGASDDADFHSSPIGAFNNLPPSEPIEIYFKDLSYSVQKMFSKSKCLSANICVITNRAGDEKIRKKRFTS
jgi:hypothetical protein